MILQLLSIQALFSSSSTPFISVLSLSAACVTASVDVVVVMIMVNEVDLKFQLMLSRSICTKMCFLYTISMFYAQMKYYLIDWEGMKV